MRIARINNDFHGQSALNQEQADLAFSALSLFRRLTITLQEAKKYWAAIEKTKTQQIANRGGPVFFMNPNSAANSEVSQTESLVLRAEIAKKLPGPAAAATVANDLLDDAINSLSTSNYVRRVARCLPDLKRAASECSSQPLCKMLLDILSMPEDETFLVIDPVQLAGIRVLSRALLSICEFHMFLLDLWAQETAQFNLTENNNKAIAAYRKFTLGNNPIAEAKLQFYHPRTKSTQLGLDGSDDWIWNNRPLSDIPVVNFERTVFIGPAVVSEKWEAERTLPFSAERLQLVERWNRNQVQAWLVEFAPDFRRIAENQSRKAA